MMMLQHQNNNPNSFNRLFLSVHTLLQMMILSTTVTGTKSWQFWNYTSVTTDDWLDIWGFAPPRAQSDSHGQSQSDSNANANAHNRHGHGPRGRQGHSMVVWNDSKVVLFGGRGNEVHRPHVPNAYDLDAYDNENEPSDAFKPLLSAYDPTCIPEKTCIALSDASSGNNESCSYSWEYLMEGDHSGSGSASSFASFSMPGSQRQKMEWSCGFAISSQLYNDVWVYDLDCRRFADMPCESDHGNDANGDGDDANSDGWRVLHPGKRYGGCRDQDQSQTKDGEPSPEQVRVCDVPSERWGHGTAMIDDSTMVVYGGYSAECEDYCDDLWAFDFQTLDWSRIFIHSTPGKRWKFSMVSITESVTERSMTPNAQQTERNDSAKIEEKNQILIFGGHRLWHGFSDKNSQENRWEDVETYPKGGYLNDLWILEKNNILNGENESRSNDTNTWVWMKQVPKESCVPSPGIAWEDRNNVRCQVFWPRERAGHAAAFDKKRNRMWIHGGYSVQYPYPSSTSAGSGRGVKGLREKGAIPFSSHSYFLDDLWYYDVDAGIWTKIRPSDSVFPEMRTNHIMVYSNDMLILNGGYSHNHYFNDTWYFDIEENRWLEKKTFVHAFYPTTCTDDIETIENDDKCVELDFPHPLRRAETDTFGTGYEDVLPYGQQNGYTPDPNYPLYFGIVNDADKFVSDLRNKYLSNSVYDEDGDKIWIQSDVPDGTPIAPYAATAPRQYAKRRRIEYNETLTLDMWEWCTSVEGEPTRDTNLDGKFGRANKTIRIHQPRRQTAGWDGCRDLRWVSPPSRLGHKGVLVEKFQKIVVYGGLSYRDADHLSGQHPVTGFMNMTYDSLVVDDMWSYGIDTCPRNCSGVGTCKNGFCKCDPGFYGLDCSNATCPGSVCYYDENYQQHCEHCCYDGYSHSDESHDYIAGVRKLPCRPLGHAIFSGHSNGVCDGFGTCQCIPPYVGEDCSIRDCPDNCNSNGFCNLEFPVARCICKEGYKGDACQHAECLNNCSYPNGECDLTTGTCTCKPIYSPHNASRIWSYWDGADCSYLLPWCSAYKVVKNCFASHSVIVMASILLIMIYN